MKSLEKRNVFEHRLLAAAKYGLEEIKNEYIHHKDGHQFHNIFENIELVARTEHKARHKQMTFIPISRHA